MMKDADQISGLMQLGERVLSASSEDEVLAFGEEFAEKAATVIESEARWDRATLEPFRQLHARVTARVQKALEQTKKELRDVKKRGKGITTYATTLPKQMNILSHKKV